MNRTSYLTKEASRKDTSQGILAKCFRLLNSRYLKLVLYKTVGRDYDNFGDTI